MLIRFKPANNRERNAIHKFGEWWLVIPNIVKGPEWIMIESINKAQIKNVGLVLDGRWIMKSQIIEEK